MFGLVTWTVRRTSASTTGRLGFKEVKLIEMRWKVGSFGFAERMEVAATAEAAPISADVQLHFTPFFSSMGDGIC